MNDLHLAAIGLFLAFVMIRVGRYREALHNPPRHIPEHHCSSMCGCRGGTAGASDPPSFNVGRPRGVRQHEDGLIEVEGCNNAR